jgi:hypothetical protein
MKQETIHPSIRSFHPIKTPRELELEDLLASARCIAQRKGIDTAWERFDSRLAAMGISSVSAKPFKILPSDL